MLCRIVSALTNKGKGVTAEGEEEQQQRGEEGKDKLSSFCAEETENNQEQHHFTSMGKTFLHLISTYVRD